MSGAAVVGPDERALRAHLESPRFQVGVDDASWEVMSVDWPIVVIALARPAQSGGRLGLRFDLAGYPSAAPTATPWHLGENRALQPAEMPNGPQASMVFRSDWNGGRALYAPWDRVALSSHADWSTKHPTTAWTSDRDLTFYLRNVLSLLTADAAA